MGDNARMIISMFHVILFRCINNTKCLLPSGLVSLGSRLCASLLQYRQQIAESPGAAAVTDGRVSGSSRHLSRAASDSPPSSESVSNPANLLHQPYKGLHFLSSKHRPFLLGAVFLCVLLQRRVAGKANSESYHCQLSFISLT